MVTSELPERPADVLNCRFAEVAVDLCLCDNVIPYETVVCKGEGGSSMALVW